MIAALTYPDTLDALYELIDGREFAGQTVTAYLRMQPDFTSHLPAVQIIKNPGAQNGPQRVDRLNVEVYATGTATGRIAEAIAAMLTASWHMTAAGRIDRIVPELTPHDVPYADPMITHYSAIYRATVRAI